MSITRRTFMKGAAASGIILSAPAIVGVESKGSNQYRTAVLGSGWWGMNIAREAIASGQCAVTSLCDADRNMLTGAAALVEELTGDKPTTYGDYRELLEKEKPQIVIVGSPDHWHPLMTIAACEAGADVYVEKPIGHTILEGRAMVQAARRTERIVQVGTHRRVSPHNMSAMQFLKEGKAGHVGMVRSFVHYGGGPGEPTPDAEPPETLDWDMWCGPAPLVPFNPRIHPRGFRRFLDFANGQLGDWGIHWLDQILWWTEEKYPRTVHSTAARHILRDNSDAPDTQVATFEFEDFTATWEHRLFAANNAEKHNVGCYFYGTRGTLHLGWQDGWTFYPSNRNEPEVHEAPTLHKPDDQNIKELWADFMDCVKTRRLPVCDIEIGHRSTNMSLLGMLSAKLGRSVAWDGQKDQVPGDEEANRLLRRDYRAPWQYPSVV